MALIRCRECGKKISEFCGVCPNCGCPVESPPNEEVNETADQPDAETSSEPKKTELTYIQKRNQRIIRIISSVILVLVGIVLVDAALTKKSEIEDDLVHEWYSALLTGNGEVGDAWDRYKEQCESLSETMSLTGFEVFLREYLSGKVLMRQLPYYIGSIGCFALAGYLLFSIKKYPLIKREQA